MIPQSTVTNLSIAGLVPFSTSDWPGKIVATVFLQGCPLRCVYCHNPALIDTQTSGRLDWDEVECLLRSRQGLLDGVIFSGGEPTRQPALLDAMQQVSNLSYAVGLHTCGAFPVILEATLPYLSWVGLDIKAPEGKYAATTGRDFAYRNAWTSLQRIQESGVDYEVRITLDPVTLTETDVCSLIDTLRDAGVKNIVIQEVRATGTTDSYRTMLRDLTLLPDVREYDPHVIIRPA